MSELLVFSDCNYGLILMTPDQEPRGTEGNPSEEMSTRDPACTRHPRETVDQEIQEKGKHESH